MMIEWPPKITLEEALPILGDPKLFNPVKFRDEQSWFIRHCLEKLELDPTLFAVTVAGATMFYSVVSELVKQAELENKTHQ